jgi:NAD(P)-dependent dehydrogenase (short-subunit alcohol dehydrogenase family)
MGNRLKGKIAIVTGAGSIGPGVGNGKATAIVFAREGAKVMVVDYNLAAAEETVGIIKKEGGECFAFRADVSRASDCQDMIETCVKKYGRIDILHNNVGIGGYGGPVETSEEDWDRIMNVNLKSMFLTCKHALPYMEKQKSGSIINISSINAIAVTAPAVAYSTSKAGVIAFTREVAFQYAAKGIRVNAILPGLIKTPMVAYYGKDAYGGDIEEMWRRRNAMSPTGKQGEPWDIAHAALFLASDEAKYITGTTLIVDGCITGTMWGTVKPQ